MAMNPANTPITGILGMNIGDGQGGKIALSVETRILRILADSKLSYYAATIANPSEVKSGTVFYRVPEILKTEDYGSGTTPANIPQSGSVSVNIDKRLTVKWEYETFDVERILDSDALIAMIAAGQAIAIENSLNAEFLDYLAAAFETRTINGQQVVGELVNSDQTLTLTTLGKKNLANELTADNVKTISDAAYIDFMKVEYVFNTISTTFNNTAAGIKKSEVISFVSPFVDSNLRVAFRNQPNQLGNWQINETLSGYQIGSWKYWTDNQLQQSIAANQSFSKKAFNFTNYVGFVLHNEAVAFPINYRNTTYVIDPITANPRFITKIQFGIGFLRPSLVYALLAPTTNRAAK